MAKTAQATAGRDDEGRNRRFTGPQKHMMVTSDGEVEVTRYPCVKCARTLLGLPGETCLGCQVFTTGRPTRT